MANATALLRAIERLPGSRWSGHEGERRSRRRCSLPTTQPTSARYIRQACVEAHAKIDLHPRRAHRIIPDYDRLAVRSDRGDREDRRCRRTHEVIGRAGIGVERPQRRHGTRHHRHEHTFASAITTAGTPSP